MEGVNARKSHESFLGMETMNITNLCHNSWTK